MPPWYVGWIGETYLLPKRYVGSRGGGGTHSKINYKTLNEPPIARRQQFFENQLNMRSHTKSVCMIWLVCIWLTIIELYIWKKLLTYQYFSFESVHGEAMLKMGLMVKKYNFSILTALNWSKCILMVSFYIWLSICTNNETLRIIWKFDLSSRGVLGRIYALSIEVLTQKLKFMSLQTVIPSVDKICTRLFRLLIECL